MYDGCVLKVGISLGVIMIVLIPSLKAPLCYW